MAIKPQMSYGALSSGMTGMTGISGAPQNSTNSTNSTKEKKMEAEREGKIKLVYSIGTSKATGQTIYLGVFHHTGLVQPSFIDVTVLDMAMKLRIKFIDLQLVYWDDEGKYQVRENSYDLRTLLKECKEVQEYCRMYYPELAI